MQTLGVRNRAWGISRTVLTVCLYCQICQGGMDAKPQPCPKVVLSPSPASREAPQCSPLLSAMASTRQAGLEGPERAKAVRESSCNGAGQLYA